MRLNYLFLGKMPQNIYRTQKREVLYFCQFLSHRWEMDRVWIWRQHGLHLEFTNERGRTKITRSHRCGFMYCLPPHWKYHCFRQFRKRQNHQNLAKWCLIYAKREKNPWKKILNIIPTICYVFFGFGPLKIGIF